MAGKKSQKRVKKAKTGKKCQKRVNKAIFVAFLPVFFGFFSREKKPLEILLSEMDLFSRLAFFSCFM